MYIPPFPKAAVASCTAESHKSLRFSAFQTARIPFPPPPAVALIMTGYPISSANLAAVS